MLLNGNEKKEGKGSLRKRKCWAHRVQTKYSLVHLICTAILCAYICKYVDYCGPIHTTESTSWIVKFEQAKSFSFPFFSLIRDIAMHFVSCFLRERKKDVASFFFSISKAFGKQAKKGWFFSILGKEGRLQHQHRQCSKDNFEEDQTTTTTTN